MSFIRNRKLGRVPCSVRNNEGLGSDNKSNIGGIINDYSPTLLLYYYFYYVFFLLLLFILINERIVVVVDCPSGRGHVLPGMKRRAIHCLGNYAIIVVCPRLFATRITIIAIPTHNIHITKGTRKYELLLQR